VRQVSVSVIGEGVIQLRGPIKGINTIRTMINQIDAPIGQVRIGIHTVQINGEHGDRMEKVAGRIQDYIDHSRFLTSQSAQMLRNAVVTVASRKAAEVEAQIDEQLAEQLALCPDDRARQELLKRTMRSQVFRDKKYVRAFFGDDFIDELDEIDSEFLHSGNKLLALHSMDTTSLASALFLLALAKNSTRLEILDEFQRMVQTDLPLAEENYFAAGAAARGKDHHHKLIELSSNAKFQSLMGFFNAQVEGGDTLNPIQREFIRLAQIFKSQLVTEMEFNQRVKERGLIEQRLGDYLQTLRKQQRRETEAEEAFRAAQAEITTGLREVAGSIESVTSLVAALSSAQDSFHSFTADLGIQKMLRELRFVPQRGDPPGPAGLFAQMLKEPSRIGGTDKLRNKSVSVVINGYPIDVGFQVPGLNLYFKSREPAAIPSLGKRISEGLRSVEAAWSKLAPTRLYSAEREQIQERIDEMERLWKDLEPRFSKPQQGQVPENLAGTIGAEDWYALVRKDFFTKSIAPMELTARNYTAKAHELSAPADCLDKGFRRLVETDIFTEEPERALRLVGRMIEALNELEDKLADPGQPQSALSKSLDAGESTLRNFIQQMIMMVYARRNYESARRPLDHKKLLDMLIDDVEEKSIELLEGVRAHTANIDAYIKSIATALDDDFNTQFYYPAFAEVRRASRYWDVNLGQIETTNVLANNRGFAKVTPQATMEFDLPKRDILINEAMNGALAMTKDFGALVADPNFLSLAKLRSGQPTSSLARGRAPGSTR
jgi:hypothetical protein